jgi:cyd operon protein YbgT
MWYFAWILGTGFAACFAIICGIWFELNKDQKTEIDKIQ